MRRRASLRAFAARRRRDVPRSDPGSARIRQREHSADERLPGDRPGRCRTPSPIGCPRAGPAGSRGRRRPFSARRSHRPRGPCSGHRRGSGTGFLLHPSHRVALAALPLSDGGTMPSTAKPFSCWNSRTAVSASGPKIPSTVTVCPVPSAGPAACGPDAPRHPVATAAKDRSNPAWLLPPRQICPTRCAAT
jgi:hypothetical protein